MALFGLWVAGSIVNSAIIGLVPEAPVMSTIGLLALLANISTRPLEHQHLVCRGGGLRQLVHRAAPCTLDKIGFSQPSRIHAGAAQ
jgi:hypothetical protein